MAEPWRLPEVAGDHASPIIGFALDGFPIYGRFECTDPSCQQIREVQSGWVQVGDPPRTPGTPTSSRGPMIPPCSIDATATRGPAGATTTMRRRVFLTF
ncbi:MAG: YHYH protein [bacterium]